MKITIPGTPVPKGRPRVRVMGKFAQIYTPPETRKAEDEFLKEAIKYKPGEPIEGPIAIDIKFYKAPPKKMPKGRTGWTTKPDLDNLVKLVIDALNKVFFKDDRQIVEITATKEYDDNPRTEFEIRKI